MQPPAQLTFGQLGDALRLVGREARLLERVGERIVTDIVEQGGEPDGQTVTRIDPGQLATLLQRRERPSGQVVGAEGVLESGMGGAGIDEKGVAELSDVAEPLDRRRIEHELRRAVEADVVPERVADDLEVVPPFHQAVGPALTTASGTSPLNCSKLSRNMPASFFACAS